MFEGIKMIEVKNNTLAHIVPRQNLKGIAERAGVSHSSLCNYLYDGVQPSLGNFLAVTEALGFKVMLLKSAAHPENCVARSLCGGTV